MEEKLGVVIEYLGEKDKLTYAEENQPFVDWLTENEINAYAIDPTKNSFDGDVANVRKIPGGELETLSLRDFRAVYFGRTGQKFIEGGVSNSLRENVRDVCRLVEKLKPHEGKVKVVNPLSSMIWNFSKQYLIDLKSTGLPFIPTIEVPSLRKLFDLKNSEEDWLVKPKIAERANGTKMLNEMTDGELTKYADEYLRHPSGDSLSNRILQRQGIIAQPFEERFVGDGEKKFFVVGGEITLSRNTVFSAMKDERYPIVSTARGARMVRYKPSYAQRDICLNVYDTLQRAGFPADFLRVDMVGIGKDSRISEIELINPATGSRVQELYTEEELDNHHRRIIDLCLQ